MQFKKTKKLACSFVYNEIRKCARVALQLNCYTLVLMYDALSKILGYVFVYLQCLRKTQYKIIFVQPNFYGFFCEFSYTMSELIP